MKILFGPAISIQNRFKKKELVGDQSSMNEQSNPYWLMNVTLYDKKVSGLNMGIVFSL